MVTVVDNIPVSRTDRIEVNDLVITPKPNEENVSDREGVMRWNLDLAPSVKREINMSFVVSYPKEFFNPRFLVIIQYSCGANTCGIAAIPINSLPARKMMNMGDTFPAWVPRMTAARIK